MDRYAFAGLPACLLFFAVSPLGAEAESHIRWTSYAHPVQFEHISVEQGLSQSSVNCIIQDTRGFIWFGTDDGLNRYDGYNFSVYRHDPADPFSLGNSRILALFEDRKGRLWIGTAGGGLNRYDRDKNRFVRYTHDPVTYYQEKNPRSLSNNSIRCIAEDREGALWLGTDGSGFGRFQRNEGSDAYSFVTYRPAGASQSNYVSAIHEDSRGVLWVGTEDGGLVKVADRVRRLDAQYLPDPGSPPSSPSNQITSIEEDQEGRLWVGTQAGLLRFDESAGTFTHFLHEPDNDRSLSSNYIRRIYKDRAGTLWIGTDGGGLNKLLALPGSNVPPRFRRYRYEPGNSAGLSDNAVESIYEDRSGVLWVGTYDNGVNKLVLRNGAGPDRERGVFVHYSVNPTDPRGLSHPSVNAIVEDSRGMLWIGTDGSGLNHAIPPPNPESRLQFFHYRARSGRPDSLSDDVVTAVCEDSRGDLWVGTYTGGLNRLPREKAGQPSPFVHYWNDPRRPDSLSANFVKVIHEDRFGRLWIGTMDGGLNRFERDTGKFARFQADDTAPGHLSDNSVFAIADDREGRLWIGTAEGLNRYDSAENTFLHCKKDPGDPAGLSGDVVRALYCDGSGTLWVGTDGGGLNKLVSGAASDKPRFKHYRRKDGLPNDSVLGILEDDEGNLWLSTHKGLCRFDPRRETFRNYDRRDGLQGNDFRGGSCWKSRSGEMFFGGSQGFNVFYPAQIIDNPNVPPIVILDFQVFNKPVPVAALSEDGRAVLPKFVTETDQIGLSHRDAVFSFEFAALHYVAPEKNSYAYWMEGLEKEWNYVGNRRFVTYTTLPAGNYVFHVKGANSDGVWNNRGLALKITIKPPFWKTAWFPGLLVALGLMFGFGVFQLRLRQLKRREAELEEQIDERTRQLGKANKQLSLANAKLRRMATKDELTGIANIRLFRTFFYREWRRVARSGRPISVIMADVDFFKLYNDTYGHGAGDECLRRVAATIQKYANRAGDLAARYGGEEFILVLSEAELRDAACLAERIRQDVEALRIPHARSSISPYVTISVGCVTQIPNPKEKPNGMLEEVDKALYLAKHEGRNRTTVTGIAKASNGQQLFAGG